MVIARDFLVVTAGCKANMDLELAGLEQKLATLLADYHRLRAENDAMRRELGRAQEQNRTLNARISAATARLDAVLQRLPAENH